MKKINSLLIFLTIIITSANFIFAQQDYQIVQNFKAKQLQIQDSIKAASSLDQLKKIQIDIDRFKNDYISHKDLLDKSLYPDDFNTSFTKLEDQLNLREQDYTQITTLQEQVSVMKIQIDSLNIKSGVLLSQIQQLQEESSKDKETIARLERNIRELRFSLHKRDRLVMTMLDSLIPPSIVENGKLTSSEKQEIYSKAKKNDLIYNIKKSIDDNIKFLEVTTLTIDDIKAIQKQQQDFKNLWAGVGPQIIDIYSERKQSVKNMKEIDSAFVAWNNAINTDVWNSINHIFTVHGINLNSFSNGEEFTEVLTSYISDEINSAKMDLAVARSTYKTFVDSVWFSTIKPIWIPFLIQNKLLTNTQADTINIKISQWQSAVIPSPFNWLYVIIAVLVIFIVILLFKFKSVKKSNTKPEDGNT